MVDDSKFDRKFIKFGDFNRKPACKKNGSTCELSIFLEPSNLTRYHDEIARQCTQELNSILNKYKSKKKAPEDELRFIQTSEGLFLAWVECLKDEDVIDPEVDDDKRILDELGLT